MNGGIGAEKASEKKTAMGGRNSSSSKKPWLVPFSGPGKASQNRDGCSHHQCYPVDETFGTHLSGVAKALALRRTMMCIARTAVAAISTAVLLLGLWINPALGAPPSPSQPIIDSQAARFISGGVGLIRPLPSDAKLLGADAPFSILAWVDGVSDQAGAIFLASLGDINQPEARRLGLDRDRRLQFWLGGEVVSTSRAVVAPRGLHFVAVTYDGRVARLYVDGVEVGAQAVRLPALPPAPPKNEWQTVIVPEFDIAPRAFDSLPNQHLVGVMRGVSLYDTMVSPDDLRELADRPPPPPPLGYETAAKPWALQSLQQSGANAPQPPATLPKSPTPPSKPVAKPHYAGPVLVPAAARRWTLAGGWLLKDATQVTASGDAVSSADYNTTDWIAATVPGTVLTTLVDRGIYPDPSYGLNNIAIPETLNKHDWWYRTELPAPALNGDRRIELIFNGINYASEIWLNGQRVGATKGAFIRGAFDVSAQFNRTGSNVLAVRVSPPPHPGIPSEQSIAAGAGDNGGAMMLDGPTFAATEGWDWIPGVRDRNTGIWQDVQLHVTGPLRLGDPRVVTRFPLADHSRADLDITVDVTNVADSDIIGTVKINFDNVNISKSAVMRPGLNHVLLSADEFAALRIAHPRLWWPNGYGAATLHDLKLTVASDNQDFDAASLRFGMREISYELSAFDEDGRLRRVELNPGQARGKRLIDGSHAGIHDAGKAFAPSLSPGAIGSPGLKLLPDDPVSPFLIVRVNGVRIAIRGGSWGMDDFMKRVSRERLEPYFRLNRDANLNVLRNWMGQNTEEVLFDLADEYGILVWNDFWESTQNYNVEAEDPGLFLKNAADVIARFRNHPSIMLWVGRNEGVPQPIINEGLERITRELDGTRYYSGSSNLVNSQQSGPYKYRRESEYFTTLGRGFATEIGIPSFPTLESFKAFTPEADRWPFSDTWSYHDWQQTGNVDTRGLIATMNAKYGTPQSLEDFEQRVQLMNYDNFRALFEGFNSGLWTRNTGRMLWMTQPAWPSSVWQIYSSDYDTHASYYAVKKANELVHIQLNPTNDMVEGINNTGKNVSGRIRQRLYSLSGKLLMENYQNVSLKSGGTGSYKGLETDALMLNGPILMVLDLIDAQRNILSHNVYVRSANDGQLNLLTEMGKPVIKLKISAITSTVSNRVIVVEIHNTGSIPALSLKLTLQKADGARVLPAFYDDNYIALMPDERRLVRIEAPLTGEVPTRIGLRAWNLNDTAEQAVDLRVQ